MNLLSQDKVVYPSVIKTPIGFAISGPLDENPIVTDFDFDKSEFYLNEYEERKIDPNIKPPDFSNLPVDPNVQTKPGQIVNIKGINKNYAGQNSGSYPPDCNGTVGATYYFQVVNTTYAIFNKSTGAIVAGPSPLNSIFNSSLPGAGFNNGDPIVLWDEQANRWFYAEFSIGTPPNYSENDYMLIAVSQTSDPTGSWYSWSYDVDDTPDYMKFGIWQDGYYMATNTGGSNKRDVYVFDRSAMIAGNANPTMIGFDNPNRPSTFDGFHCILPLDNDGSWAPSGTPGQFITIVDDGQSNPADELWIFQLNADWTTPSNSTFSRTQTLSVNSFSGNFTSNWDNIPQPNTSRKLDGLSTILMYRAQYRNFNGTQKIVCAHAIAENSSEAAIRWYELENTGSGWSIRQQGTYNPDNVSRWNVSIAMNSNQEIAMGYSVSNSSVYPGIRICAQSASAHAAANNTMDIAETTIWTGSYSQTSYNRWGDYSNISVDPSDGTTFWYTNEYVGSSTHGTRIASYQLPAAAPAADFTANNLYPINTLTTVVFTDQSSGGTPTSWSWSFSPSTVTFVGGTSATSQNPQVRFNNSGAYTVSLYVSNASGNDTETKTEYIHVGQAGLWTGASSTDWDTKTNWENHEIPGSSIAVSITPTATSWPVKTGNLTIGTDCISLNMGSGITALTVTGDLTISTGSSLSVDASGTATIKIGGTWTNNGTFSQGASTVEFYGTGNSVINTQGSGPVYLINDDFSNWTGNWNGDISSSGTTNGKFNHSFTNNAGGTSPEARFLYETTSGNYTRRMYYNSVNTSGLTSLILNFTHELNHVSGTNLYTIKTEYSTDGINWNNTGWSIDISASIPATSVSTTLTTAQGVGSTTYYISFTITGDLYYVNDWYIDDVKLYYNSTGKETYNNLTINKSAAMVSTNGNVDIQNDFVVKPDAWFTLASGNTMNVSGNLVLEADQYGAASFIDNGTTNVTGTTNVQYFCSSGAWHYISASFDPGTNHFTDLFSGNNPLDFYRWDESHTEQGSTGWWINILHGDEWNTGSFVAAKGYAITDNTKGTLYSFQGNLYKTGKTLTMTKTSGSVAEGWNLVGNPFPSNIAANTNADGSNNFLSANTSVLDNSYTAIYLWDDNAGDYVTFSNSSPATFISPGQGFMVKTAANGNNISFTSALRKHGASAFFKAGDETQRFHITVIDPQNKTNKAEIVFMDNMTLGLDPSYDAGKYKGNPKLSLYTLMVANSTQELSIQALPLLDEPVAVPVGIHAGNTGNFSFTVETANFDENIPITLVDHYTAKQVDLRENPVYPFVVGEAGTFNDRFVIFFKSSVGIEDEVNTDQQSFDIYSRGKRITVVPFRKTDSYSVHIFNIVGQEILVRNVSGNDPVTIDMNNSTGYYVVKVQSDKDVITKKVLVK